MPTSARRAASGALLLAALVMSACADPVATRDDTSVAQLRITADLSATTISTMVVTVSAPDIATALVFNLPVANGSANGTIKVAPGAARTITVVGYESDGQQSYEGHKTVDVKPGQNPPVSIPMVSKGGQVPVVVQLGAVSVTVTPVAVTLLPGDTKALSSVIVAVNGDVVSDVPNWATSNPTVATVSSAGVVSAAAPGQADIVATYAGIAAVSHVTVPTVASYGNSTDFFDQGYFAANYLFGSAVTVTHAITVTHLCIVSISGTGNVRLALYNSNGLNRPNQLVASAGPARSVAGHLELPVATPAVIPAGTYWLMGNYDTNQFIKAINDMATDYYMPQNFTSALPTTFSADPLIMNGFSYNLYLKGTF